MDLDDRAGVLGRELGGGELCKQWVNSEPFAAFETLHEHVGLLEFGQ